MAKAERVPLASVQLVNSLVVDDNHRRRHPLVDVVQSDRALNAPSASWAVDSPGTPFQVRDHVLLKSWGED